MTCQLTLTALASLLLLARQGIAADASAERRVGSFANTGLYSSGTTDGSTLIHQRARLDQGLRAGPASVDAPGTVRLLQLENGKKWRGDPKETLTRLRAWLQTNDLSHISILMLDEEHPYDVCNYMQPLLDEIRKQCDVPVYVWPSYPLGPPRLGDGYVYDAYGARYEAIRNHVVEFLRTGKPMILCVDGSGYSDLTSAREQVMVCREFDLPAFYFVAADGSGGYNGWCYGHNAHLLQWRNLVFSGMEFQRRDLPAGDFVWGNPIELMSDPSGAVHLSLTGIADATVYGMSHLGLRDGLIQSTTDTGVSLDYQFWSLFPLDAGRLTLELDGAGMQPPRVERSRCGQIADWTELEAEPANEAWTYSLGNPTRECRLRLTLAGAHRTAIRSLAITGTMNPPEDRAIPLDMFYDGWRGRIRYTEDLAKGRWRVFGSVDRPENLEPNRLALRGRDGYAVVVNVTERFTSQQPLRDIVLTLRGTCNSANLGGAVFFGVSLDGNGEDSSIVWDTGTFDATGQTGERTLDLSDSPDFQDIRAFTVHMRQRNGSGRRGNVSSMLDRLEIVAARSAD